MGCIRAPVVGAGYCTAGRPECWSQVAGLIRINLALDGYSNAVDDEV